MKNLVLALVVSLGLAACEGAGLPGGVDAVDAGAEASAFAVILSIKALVAAAATSVTET